MMTTDNNDNSANLIKSNDDNNGSSNSSKQHNIVNIIEDVSTLTTIPVRTLDKLVSKVCWCICDAIEESQLQSSNMTILNIGIGQLCISLVDDEIQYKFIPSAKLEKYIVDTVVNKQNPLVSNIESTFVNRIVRTYKDMI